MGHMISFLPLEQLETYDINGPLMSPGVGEGWGGMGYEG